MNLLAFFDSFSQFFILDDSQLFVFSFLVEILYINHFVEQINGVGLVKCVGEEIIVKDIIILHVEVVDHFGHGLFQNFCLAVIRKNQLGGLF